MTSVKAGGGDDPHVAVLLGKLLLEVRAAFAGEDWGGLRQSHFRLLSQVPPAGVYSPGDVESESGGSLFRRTIIRVMTVQIVALLLLWLLQRTYSG